MNLTPRELEILHMFQNGFTAKEISTSLGISAQTVQTHRKSILYKTGGRNVTHAICIFYGIVRPKGINDLLNALEEEGAKQQGIQHSEWWKGTPLDPDNTSTIGND